MVVSFRLLLPQYSYMTDPNSHTHESSGFLFCVGKGIVVVSFCQGIVVISFWVSWLYFSVFYYHNIHYWPKQSHTWKFWVFILCRKRYLSGYRGCIFPSSTPIGCITATNSRIYEYLSSSRSGILFCAGKGIVVVSFHLLLPQYTLQSHPLAYTNW